ncbi:tol-pal system protein YbgF [Acidihalobacter yilgarnensis]|uniref:Cell division coordinator CpoB n=1 Tax=Acidihalobacter yilgarnensis TaxID=2819280 RepID=A0A1D8IR35_9GAMM|nr:tol-pal system protein YbgF [Acidihalobacter yilgarnensis]AOU98951.1 tol-pal system protein YbgF [Acidihalobacter yilgarnensis]
MRSAQWIPVVLLGAAIAASSIPAHADDSQAVIQLYQQITGLQQEIRELRGQNQEITHELDDLRKRQRELYMNTDQRLQALEAAVSGGATAASSGSAANGGTGSPSAASPSMPSASTGQPAASSTSTPAAVAVASGGNGLDAYQQAFNLLKNSHYHEAVDAFKSFIKQYPQSPYVPNAAYWMGEALYVEQHFNQALAQFRLVVNQYPQSNKVAASMLKIGYSQYELKQWPSARKTLQNVVNNYPGTSAARLAADRLSRMQREGH